MAHACTARRSKRCVARAQAVEQESTARVAALETRSQSMSEKLDAQLIELQRQASVNATDVDAAEERLARAVAGQSGLVEQALARGRAEVVALEESVEAALGRARGILDQVEVTVEQALARGQADIATLDRESEQRLATWRAELETLRRELDAGLAESAGARRREIEAAYAVGRVAVRAVVDPRERGVVGIRTRRRAPRPSGSATGIAGCNADASVATRTRRAERGSAVTPRSAAERINGDAEVAAGARSARDDRGRRGADQR